MRRLYLFLLLNLSLLGSNLEARNPFQAEIIVGPASATVSDSNVVSFINDLKFSAIQSLIPFYTPTSPVNFNINLRGLTTLASFAAASNILQVDIPQAGISQFFIGTTRDESFLLFENYLKDNAGGSHKLLRAFARYTAIDPIGGNPNSLMSIMAQSDYAYGRLSPQSGCSDCWSAQPVRHQFQGGLQVGRTFSQGFDTTTFFLPLRYSYSPDRNWALILDAPVMLLKNGGAYSLSSSLGVALRIPVTHLWSLTPTVRFGLGGSFDLISGGSFISPGIVSNLNYPVGDFVLTMTNSFGYYCTVPLHLGGVSFSYRLYNFVFKNGLALTSCNGLCVCNRPVNFSLTFTDTDFQGTALFISHYDEIGISLFSTHINPNLKYDCLSLGFVYQFGQQGYKGYNLNLVYQF